MANEQSFPSETRVVIIGGGIVGCSLAYHLAKLGWKDVVVLEQAKLAGGTTWHAAGLIGRLRTSNSLTKINKYSAELYAGLEKETGHPTGWKQVGSLIVTRHPERLTQLYRTCAMAEWFGVETHMISPGEAQEKWPFLRVDDLLGAAWLPHDGKVIPKELTLSLAAGAKAQGVQVFEETEVLSLMEHGGRVRGVKTSRGEIGAEYVVICGGMWSRQLAAKSGVCLPLFPVEHHYVVTEPVEGARDDLPVGRDPDERLYFRGEGNQLVLGAFQLNTKAWEQNPIPSQFSFQLLEPDWEKYQDPIKAAHWRLPVFQGVKYERFVNGPESFTPDNQFLMGETREVKGLYVSAGYNSVGIASAGGAGKYLAEWMVGGEPPMDLWSVDIRRFGGEQNNRLFLQCRTPEILGLHYEMAWPNREMESGRGLRRSPFHRSMEEQGACFGLKNGWERPNWFARPPVEPVVRYSFGKQNWFECHRAEHVATREGVVVFDQSGFSKYRLFGADVVSFLERMCGNRMDVPVGQAVYTGLFNEKGGYESDLVAVRRGVSEYYLISGTAQTQRDLDWFSRCRREGERVDWVNVTNGYAVLGVMGPCSRKLLQGICNVDLGHSTFPFSTAQEIELGWSTCLAIRLSYVGELGWELHVPVDQAMLLYETLVKAGRSVGLIHGGHYAINSLRLEKGYRAWGAELTPDDTPLEAGLGFTVDWKKEGFLGRAALMKQKAEGVRRRLGLFTLEDPEVVLWGNEPIFREGKAVGYTTSASYGHSVGRAVAMGYVHASEAFALSDLEKGVYEIRVGKDRKAAKVHKQGLYDVKREKLLC